jgi:hypothetical protein
VLTTAHHWSFTEAVHRVIPHLPFAAVLAFGVMPPHLPILALIILAYIATAEVTKALFYRNIGNV